MCKNIRRGLVAGLQPVGQCGDTVCLPRQPHISCANKPSSHLPMAVALACRHAWTALPLRLWAVVFPDYLMLVQTHSVSACRPGLILPFPCCLDDTWWHCLNRSPLQVPATPLEYKTTQAGPWPAFLTTLHTPPQHLVSLKNQEILVG